HKQASVRVSTGDLNRVVRQALDDQPPPLRQNRRPKVYYATQVAANPPTIVLFTNGAELFDSTYQRYLIKTFRDQLPFHEVPIRLHLRRRHREDQEPAEDPKPTAAGEERRKSRKKASDVTQLQFKSKVTDEELKRDRDKYESELWKDL